MTTTIMQQISRKELGERLQSGRLEHPWTRAAQFGVVSDTASSVNTYFHAAKFGRVGLQIARLNDPAAPELIYAQNVVNAGVTFANLFNTVYTCKESIAQLKEDTNEDGSSKTLEQRCEEATAAVRDVTGAVDMAVALPGQFANVGLIPDTANLNTLGEVANGFGAVTLALSVGLDLHQYRKLRKEQAVAQAAIQSYSLSFKEYKRIYHSFEKAHGTELEQLYLPTKDWESFSEITKDPAKLAHYQKLRRIEDAKHQARLTFIRRICSIAAFVLGLSAIAALTTPTVIVPILIALGLIGGTIGIYTIWANNRHKYLFNEKADSGRALGITAAADTHGGK